MTTSRLPDVQEEQNTLLAPADPNEGDDRLMALFEPDDFSTGLAEERWSAKEEAKELVRIARSGEFSERLAAMRQIRRTARDILVAKGHFAQQTSRLIGKDRNGNIVEYRESAARLVAGRDRTQIAPAAPPVHHPPVLALPGDVAPTTRGQADGQGDGAAVGAPASAEPAGSEPGQGPVLG